MLRRFMSRLGRRRPGPTDAYLNEREAVLWGSVVLAAMDIYAGKLDQEQDGSTIWDVLRELGNVATLLHRREGYDV